MQEMSPDETVRAALQISHIRLRAQHELVVEFGVKSLRSVSLDDLLTHACVTVAKGMKTRFAKVLQLMANGEQFLLSHGIGWDSSDIGRATVGADDASPAGYAFNTNRPVISNHLGQEHRFRTPSLLKKYGIERAINVPIRSTSASFGVLEADSSDGDDFIESDLVFMEGIANVISMAVERLAADAESSATHLYSESILNASPDCVTILSTSGEAEFFNAAGLAQMELNGVNPLFGRLWADLWPSESQDVIHAAVKNVAAGESVRFESSFPSQLGNTTWWDITAAPVLNENGEVEKIIAVSRDITERHDQEMKLASLIESQSIELTETGFHLEEIHHRVKNSLHLVSTLLLLQSNLAGEEAVKTQFQTAAGRVMTIATVHEHLYQDISGQIDVERYLRTLLEDMSKAFDGREMKLYVDPFPLPSERMAPLGLIVSELVTNALKYGKGIITVNVESPGDHAVIVVSDQGEGFPDTYPKPSGTGLGMRLVRSYSGFGNAAITVDRSANTSTIRVLFRL